MEIKIDWTSETLLSDAKLLHIVNNFLYENIPNDLDFQNDKKSDDDSAEISSTDIKVWKWKDNKIVHFANNFHECEVITVKRTQKDGSKADIVAPSVVKDYSTLMGGVDHAHRLRTVYGLNRLSTKWWHRLFWGLIDITFVNTYIIFCDIRE
ncbi:hypothetical protein ILUMI_14382 [Ignelater luminosus]|uniref:PiggyBac transposable element-derived protein domain-containing protein n=1 Tax=Ignelater luminosus TaxID=2038154 RepID=A0A8K0CV04_IGNLU|nr:hypothetical protein ILUMI_14382 [Ignelater luminosus]